MSTFPRFTLRRLMAVVTLLSVLGAIWATVTGRRVLLALVCSLTLALVSVALTALVVARQRPQ